MEQCRRVAVYVRVSTFDQDSGLQLREIEEYLHRRGVTSWMLFEDVGSGSDSARPALNKMIHAARRREIDLIVCWRLDRLFRSLRHLLGVLNDFLEDGTKLVSIRDGIDLTTSSGRLMMQIVGAFAEFEVSLLRERVRAGLNNARAKGTRLGRPPQRDDAEIARLRTEGLSVRQIASRLRVSPSMVQRSLAVPKTPKNPDGKSQ